MIQQKLINYLLIKFIYKEKILFDIQHIFLLNMIYLIKYRNVTILFNVFYKYDIFMEL